MKNIINTWTDFLLCQIVGLILACMVIKYMLMILG